MTYPGNGWEAVSREEHGTPNGRPANQNGAANHGASPEAVRRSDGPQQVATRPRGGLLTRSLTGAVRISVAAASLPLRVARPIVMSRPMAPAREAANAVVNKVSDALVSVVAEQLLWNNEAQMLVEEYAERLILLLAQNRLVEQLVRIQADSYIGYLSENPAEVAPLVEAAANSYIATLEQQPERVDGLVRSAAGRYIAHLTQSPDVIDPLVRSVAQGYIDYLAAHPELAGDLVENVAAGYIAHLQAHPEVLDGVVEGAAERYMASARTDPTELNKLVQVVGDQYMEYLRVYPDNVQDLLAGQTASITADVVTEVRQRSASGDVKLETALRNLLRMKPREEKRLTDIEPLS